MGKKKGNSSAISSSDDWQIESDLRTLQEAKEIQADPQRMARCQKLAQKKLKDMAAIAGSDC